MKWNNMKRVTPEKGQLIIALISGGVCVDKGQWLGEKEGFLIPGLFCSHPAITHWIPAPAFDVEDENIETEKNPIRERVIPSPGSALKEWKNKLSADRAARYMKAKPKGKTK